MDTTEFWKLIDKSGRASDGDAEQQLEALGALLDELTAEDIIEFDNIFSSYFHLSYTWPLWGAAYVIGGGCSDDSFDYFRGWLISRGEQVFAAAIAEPDELASLIEEGDEEIECQVEGWQSVAVDAWCRKTKQEYTAFPVKPGHIHGNDPTGEEWDEDDLDRLYPKLSSRFN
jgi:Protein of unknown function (DUF4240)